MRTSRQLFILCAFLLGAAACNSGDTTDDDIECGLGGSCPMGLICDPRTNKCVANTGRDAALPDGRVADARITDAAPIPDGPRFDAGATPDAASPPDASAPDGASGTTMILSGPPARTTALMGTFTFSGGGTYTCRVDSAAFASCTTPHTVTVAEGAHVFEVIATPAGGVPDPTPASYSWEVDRTGPNVDLSGPAEGSTTGRIVTFTWTVEAGAAVSCSLDSTALAPCDGGMKSYTLLAGGGHIFRIRAEDDLGNDGAQIDRAFSVDAVGPTAMITPFANDLSDAAGTLLYSSEAGATFECRLNSATYAPCPASGLAFTGLPPGRNTARVRATDTHGNLGTEAVYSWEVFGTAQVFVALQSAAQADRIVVSHRADGAVLDETKTDASGRATARVLPDSQVTAAMPFLRASRLLFTMVGVQPGDSVRLEVGNLYPEVATLRVGGSAADPCCASYFVAVGGRGLFDASTQPVLNGDFPLADESYDTNGRVSFLGQARANSSVLRMLPVADRTVPRGSTTDLVVTTDQWTDAVPYRFLVTNVTSQFTIEPGVYRRGVTYPVADGRDASSPDNTEGFSFHTTPDGFADGRYVRLRARMSPMFKSIVATDVDALDFGQLMPSITETVATQPVVGRPQVSWKTDGPVDGADGTLVFLPFNGGDTGPSGNWIFIVPATVASVQAPILPASLPDWAPAAGATFTTLVEIIDSSAMGGYTAFKRQHQRFFDASNSGFSDFDDPPVVPGAGTTTRTTERIVSQ